MDISNYTSEVSGQLIRELYAACFAVCGDPIKARMQSAILLTAGFGDVKEAALAASDYFALEKIGDDAKDALTTAYDFNCEGISEARKKRAGDWLTGVVERYLGMRSYITCVFRADDAALALLESIDSRRVVRMDVEPIIARLLPELAEKMCRKYLYIVVCQNSDQADYVDRLVKSLYMRPKFGTLALETVRVSSICGGRFRGPRTGEEKRQVPRQFSGEVNITLVRPGGSKVPARCRISVSNSYAIIEPAAKEGAFYIVDAHSLPSDGLVVTLKGMLWERVYHSSTSEDLIKDFMDS